MNNNNLIDEINTVSDEIKRLLGSAKLPKQLVVVDNQSKLDNLPYLIESYQNNCILVMVCPTQESLKNLVSAVGIFTTIDFTDLSNLEIVAFKKPATFSFTRPINKMQLATYKTAGNELIKTENIQIEDTENLLKKRVDYFISWTQQALDPKHPARIAMAADTPPQGDPGSLWSQANMFYGTKTIPIQLKTSSTDFVTVFMQFSFYAAAICQFKNDTTGAPETDWYLATLNCTFNPSNGYFSNTSTRRGWYVDWYRVQMEPTDYTQDTNCTLESHAPATQNTPDIQGSVSTDVSNSINGSIGFFGPTFTANVGYSRTWSYGTSQSFVIESCKVRDYSGNNQAGNNGQWEFTFPDVINQSGALTEPVAFSRDSFQPICAALWHMPTSERKTDNKQTGVNIKCSIDVQFINAYIDGQVVYQKYLLSSDSSIVSNLSQTWLIKFAPTQADLQKPTKQDQYPTLADTPYFNKPSDPQKAGTYPKGTLLSFIYKVPFNNVDFYAVEKDAASGKVFVHSDAINVDSGNLP